MSNSSSHSSFDKDSDDKSDLSNSRKHQGIKELPKKKTFVRKQQTK